MKNVARLLAVACFFFALHHHVQALPACAAVPVKSPEKVHRHGQFVLYYDLAGQHALNDPQDRNSNDLPDIIEDTALQLQAMHDVLAHLEFADPLKRGRYAGQGVEAIHVRFTSMKGNGTAMDEPRTLPDQACGLLINLSNKLPKGNLTPAHEYFHLVQYAYAPYKRSWYLEGMARWSETLLGRDVAFGQSVVDSANVEPSQLFAMSYDSYAAFWRGFAAQSSEPYEHSFPLHVKQSVYSNGEPVVRDATVYGAKRMRRALEALSEQGLRDGKRLGFNAAGWPEAAQRDTAHDKVMLQVLQGVQPAKTR